MVQPDDVGRFAEVGVIADLQQSPDAVSAEYHQDLTGIIGDRALDLVPTGQVADTGGTTLSRDWDADPRPPLGTIERALRRPTTAVSDLETALRMHTIDAAYAPGHDDATGSIKVGKLADYVIVDRNLFDVHPTKISEAEILLTVVDGRIVYQAPGLSP